MKPEVNTKQCAECRANLPHESYGLAKYSRDGRSTVCNPCRSQYNRLRRKRVHNAKSKVDDSMLRNISFHNEAVLDLVLPLEKAEIIAYNCVSKQDFKVFFGRSEALGLKCMTIFNMDGTVFLEQAYSGLAEPKKSLAALIDSLDLRLELTIVEAMASKNVIYYL